VEEVIDVVYYYIRKSISGKSFAGYVLPDATSPSNHTPMPTSAPLEAYCSVDSHFFRL